MPTYNRVGQYRSTTGILDKNQLVLYTRRGPIKSIRSRGKFWVFYWWDVATGQVFTTHVDSTMDNFDAWQDLCLDPEPWGVYEGLCESDKRSKSSGLPVISADGLPERWLDLTEKQAQEVVELDIDQRAARNNFNLLFD